MRTSRLLLALGAIQLLIMFTCIALPSIRLSAPKRASSLAARPVLPPPPPAPPIEWHWHVDLAAPALQTSIEAKLKPYELWLMPPSPPLRLIQQQQQQQQQRQLPSSGDQDVKAHPSARPPSSRKLNPKYAMKFNQEALKQQQQQQQQQQSVSDSASRPSSPPVHMFQSRATTCQGTVSFRYYWLKLMLQSCSCTIRARHSHACSMTSRTSVTRHTIRRDITAVTHMSVDREARLHDLEQRWPGPIVAAIYTRSSAGAASVPTTHPPPPTSHSLSLRR
jgi:hypothetical protein